MRVVFYGLLLLSVWAVLALIGGEKSSAIETETITNEEAAVQAMELHRVTARSIHETQYWLRRARAKFTYWSEVKYWLRIAKEGFPL